MITAIDFGSHRIRSIFRNPDHPERLSMFVERCEYALLANSEQHRTTLESRHIPYAVCEDALAVVGNQAAEATWLSRVPCAPLMPEGIVPGDDPPARQLLNLLVTAMLPRPKAGMNLCSVVLPGLTGDADELTPGQEFLCRLVQMAGYEPMPVNAAEAAVLAVGGETAFTGISIVMGAETTDICASRFGRPLASATLAVGGNWIDTELARQFRIYAWDNAGACYLDLEHVRTWKRSTELNLRQAMGERERTLTKLYTVVLDKVTRAVAEILQKDALGTGLRDQRLSVMLSGGSVRVPGFSSLLTDRLIEHQIADRVRAVQIARDPELAVIRGALIHAELEGRSRTSESAAA